MAPDAIGNCLRPQVLCARRRGPVSLSYRIGSSGSKGALPRPPAVVRPTVVVDVVDGPRTTSHHHLVPYRQYPHPLYRGGLPPGTTGPVTTSEPGVGTEKIHGITWTLDSNGTPGIWGVRSGEGDFKTRVSLPETEDVKIFRWVNKKLENNTF